MMTSKKRKAQKQEGQARGASTVEDSGRKQTKNPAFCQCMTNKGNGHIQLCNEN